jgi:hypothetical protein
MGCVRFVCTFFDKGFCAMLSCSDMRAVYLELQRARFVSGGVYSRCMLSALTRAHLRHSSALREGFGSRWDCIASLAAVLGDEGVLDLALPHLEPSWDSISWQTVDAGAGGGGGGEEDDAQTHYSALIRA